MSVPIGKYKVMTVNNKTPPPIPVAADKAEVNSEVKIIIKSGKRPRIIMPRFYYLMNWEARKSSFDFNTNFL